MRITSKRRTVQIHGTTIGLARNRDGVVELWAQDDVALALGLGFVHAHDRMVQMMLVRLVGQGRLCECLKDSKDTLSIDVFMREMGLRREAEADVASLQQGGLELGEAYAEGVNHYLSHYGRPFELKLVRYRPEPWTVSDTLLTIKLMSYVGLAQSQQDIEKFLIQALREGVSPVRLKQLFAPHLDHLDDTTIENLRHLKHVQPLVPEAIRFLAPTPTMITSNNWAISGHRSASGSSLQCNDPHLECNRLPAIWYESIMHTSDNYRLGATMPGIPGLVMGRTRDLSFGFTYGFMDMVDFFIEDCIDGACRRGESRIPLDVRTETILRKGGEPIEIFIRENEIGVLESDPLKADLPDGLYLSRAWSAHKGGAAASLDSLSLLTGATTVADAQVLAREVTISCNWLFADRAGNIGYQQSGLLPDRQHSGVHPVPAWNEDFRWKGMVPAASLHTTLNPEEGILVTANNDFNPPGGPLAVNLPMGIYRAERIQNLLHENRHCTIDDMKRIQNDLYSLQAERLMEILRPLLPETFAGRLLAGWNLQYDLASRAATLFEEVYQGLLREVFGKGLFGLEVWDEIINSTSIVANYYRLFDEILLGKQPEWFADEPRETVFRRVLEEKLTEVDPIAILPWGQRQQIFMTNIFFDGRLPRFLGFDHGPIELPGNRATVVQGGVFYSHDRQTTFTPSWRFITDLGDDTAETVLAGGPSGNRFSRWYKTDVKRWLGGTYKTLRGE